MSELTGYVCWNRENVFATIATEAVSPSDSVFLATHAPLDILRVAATAHQGQAQHVVTEAELLDDFLKRPTNSGVLVVSVLGASGAGKSHLVRWVHANTPRQPKRRVIYLPKDSTSLAGVVGKLLLGLDGPPFDDIRRDVGKLGRDITRDALERRLLDQLAESLRVCEPGTPQERALVGENGLYLLLHDPFFRAHLLRPGALVPRRAAHAIDGRGIDEPDVPLQFTVEDLPSNALDVTKAAEASQRLFGQLVANDALKPAAIQLLNRHLDVAVMQAADLGVGRLQQAFLAIRRALAAGGEEIVMLVEDFALVQGIQRDLLDAILETSQREGRTVLAPIRTLLAVTTGYYGSLVDTVRTRIESSSPVRYELRVSLGHGAEGVERTENGVIDFVGRYLNAARLGRDRIDEAGARDAASVENVCDECPVREPCHTGFGTASTGHGLYPYNRLALLRAVRASAPTPDPDDFNPRAALARVVRHVLSEHASAIEHRDFPNGQFAEDFPPRPDDPILSPTVSALAAATSEGPRRRVLLEYWGGAPKEFVNLAPEIHDAFAIPIVPNIESITSTQFGASSPTGPAPAQPARPVTARATPAAAEQLPESTRRMVAAIAEWNGRAAILPEDVAREIRRIVRDATVSRIAWADPSCRPLPAAQLNLAWPNTARTVSIEGARESIAKGVSPPIRFERTPANARFFEELIRLQAGQSRGTLQARLRLDRLAERYAPLAQRAALTWAGRTDAELTEALRVALVGAACRGTAIPGDKAVTLLNAALQQETHPRADVEIRSPLWVRLDQAHAEQRAELVKDIRNALGASQDMGAVLTLDAVRALRLIKAAARSWTLPASDARPSWSVQPAKTLSPLETAVDDQLERLHTLVHKMRQRLPRGTSFADTIKAVQEAIDVGEHRGFVRHDDVPDLKQRNASAATSSSRDLETLENDLAALADGATYEQRLVVAARDRGAGLATMGTFLLENERWIDESLAAAEDQTPDQDAADLVARVNTVITQWQTLAEGPH
jgi:type II secretory pathway predicted ATPase ExeA